MTAQFWALLASVATVVGVPVAVYTSRDREKRGVFEYRVSRVWDALPATLVTEPGTHGPRDAPSRTVIRRREGQQTVVRLYLRNAGEIDIDSGHFDAGRPTLIELGCEVIGRLEVDEPGNTRSLPVRHQGRDILIGPGLLKRGQEFSGTWLLARPPVQRVTITLTGEIEPLDLNNATVTRFPRRLVPNWRVHWLTLVAVLLAGFVAAAIFR